MAKRNRTVSILAMPFAVIVWLAGWVFVSVGSKRQVLKQKKSIYHAKLKA